MISFGLRLYRIAAGLDGDAKGPDLANYHLHRQRRSCLRLVRHSVGGVVRKGAKGYAGTLGKLISLLCLLLCPLFRPLPGYAAGSGNWRTYTTRDGLLSNRVQALAYHENPPPSYGCHPETDSDCPAVPGLWVGTDRGLTYLNGRDSISFVAPLFSPDVRDLLLDANNRLWIATARGLTWLDWGSTPEDDRDNQWLAKGLTVLRYKEVLSLAGTADGRLWAGTTAGLFEVDPNTGETLQAYLSNARVTALPTCPHNVPDCKVGADGELWIGTGAGLYRLDLSADGTEPESVDDFPWPSPHVTALTVAPDGLWVGTDAGAAHWDGARWDRSFVGSGDLASADVRAIDVDERGRVWFATAAGASRWDPAWGTWQRFFAFRDPIASDHVQALLVDSHGMVWLGTEEGLSGGDGSWTLLDQGTMHDGRAPLASGFVSALALDRETGQAWVGTYGGGVTVFDRDLKAVATFTTENSALLSDSVTALDSSAGRVWVGTYDGGVTVFDRDLKAVAAFTSQNSALPSDSVTALALDPSTGRAWVGTDGGAVVFDRDLRMEGAFTAGNDKLVGDAVQALALDQHTGRAWAGTADGVTIFDRNLGVEARFTSVESENAVSPDLEPVLMPGSVEEVAVDPNTGQAWVLTSRGVTTFDGDLEVKNTFSFASGAPSYDFASALTLDLTTGRAWVGADGGVLVLDRDLEVVATFPDEEEAAEIIFARVLALDSEAGRAWVGIGRGVTVFNRDLETVATFTSENSALASDSATALALDPSTGRAWVGTLGGVTVFDSDLRVVTAFTAQDGALAPDFVMALSLDPGTGRAWVEDYFGGVTVLDRRSGVVAAYMPKVMLSFDPAMSLLFGPRVAPDLDSERVWVGTLGSGVIVFDRDRVPVATFTAEDGALANDFVMALALDPHTGRVWAGTFDAADERGGLTVFDRDLQVVRTFSAEDGVLAGDAVTALALDPDKERAWVGTYGGRVIVFDQDLEVVATAPAGDGAFPDPVGSLALDPNTGRVWAASLGSGVTVFDSNLQVVATFTAEDGVLADDWVAALALDPATGRAWVGTESGAVTVFDRDLQVVETLLTDGEAAVDFFGTLAIALDPATGRVWVGAGNTVTVFDQDLQAVATFVLAPGAFADETFVTALALDPNGGRVWVGAFGGGMSLFEPRGRAPWVRLSPATVGALAGDRLLDRQEILFSFDGGSLTVPPLRLGYRLKLEDVEDEAVVIERTFAPGDVGVASPGQVTLDELAYHRHRLTLSVSDPDLKTYALPVLEFDVQASPQVTLTRMAGFAPHELPSEPFSAKDPLAVEWIVVDPDARRGDPMVVEFIWYYGSYTETAEWQPADGNAAEIYPPALERGTPDQTWELAIRVTDVDDNLSSSAPVPLTFRPPASFSRLLAPYFQVGGLVLFVLVVGLAALSRTSGLPVGLLVRQGLVRWIPVGLGYRRYRAQWSALTPLEKLLLLLFPPDKEVTLERLQTVLAERQTLVESAGGIERALGNLVRQRLLAGQGEAFWLTEPELARALQMHEAESGVAQLSSRVRDEHPLYAEVRLFFLAAGFELYPLDDPFAFLCRPASATWERQFDAPVYSRLFLGRPLDREAVMALHEAAKTVAERSAVLFAIVDQTPADSGWIEIGALRAEGVQVVPIDDAIIRRGRERQRELQELAAHLRRHLGRRRDLYNVRHPVADRLNFFGREARANELLEALIEGRPLALFGLRKMGKSSFLQYMRDRAPFPVALVDLEAGAELGGLYARILDAWQRSLRVKFPLARSEGESLDGWKLPALSGEPSTAFTAAVGDLMAWLEASGHTPRLGLFVDEVEVIVPRGRDGADDLDSDALARYLAFARTLRGLIQETGQLSLLVTGVDPRLNRVSRWAGQQNPLYQFFRQEYLGPLGREDCVQMVRNIGRQMGLAYSDEAVAFVAQVSGGHPFLARQLCSAALRALGEEISGEITLAQLQSAAGRFVREPGTAALLDEKGLWGEVTSPELWPQPQILENQALLTSLAQVEPQPESDLLAAAQNRSARERSLYELEQRTVLGRLEEMLRIQFGLFRIWIERYKLEGG
jgi:ligand-binding sensor domain-containing protein